MGFDNPKVQEKALATRRAKQVALEKGELPPPPPVPHTDPEMSAFRKSLDKEFRKYGIKWAERIDYLLHNATKDHSVQADLAKKILDKLYPDQKAYERPAPVQQSQGVKIVIGADLSKAPIEVKEYKKVEETEEDDG